MRKVKYGAYLILPLKYNESELEKELLARKCPVTKVDTMDLGENIKMMFNGNNDMKVGSVHELPLNVLADNLGGDKFSVENSSGKFSFRLMPSYIYTFHTRVAFLCLGLDLECMEALYAIYNPGFSENSSGFYLVKDNEDFPMDFAKNLENFVGSFGMKKFFDGESSILLESYTYILALCDERFQSLEELRHKTFNLHQMVSIDTLNEDDSEEDIRYIYAVKDLQIGGYRWGICVSSQTISYAVADPDMDFASEMNAQAKDGMPLVLLALYEKYTCLRFTELIAGIGKKKAQQLKELKDIMLKFRAFGTVSPANVSRWNNVRQILTYLQEVCGIEQAIEDISCKLNILTEQQKEIEQSRNDLIMNLITIFGIVSILASVQSIIQILCDGNMIIWTGTILTTGILAVVFGLALRYKK